MCRYCKEQDLNIFAIQLEVKTSNLFILNIFRASSGDFNKILRGLDASLKYLYDSESELWICGDINVDYLNKSNSKETHYWQHIIWRSVNFATGIQNDSSTATEHFLWIA